MNIAGYADGRIIRNIVLFKIVHDKVKKKWGYKKASGRFAVHHEDEDVKKYFVKS